MAQMTNLLNCPEEIIFDIFASFEPHELISPSLVNKRLHRAVEPLLYSRIQWTWGENEAPPPIHLLLATILEKPELANHTHSLTLKGQSWGWTGRWWGKLPPKLEAEDTVLIPMIRSLEELTPAVPYRDTWLRELRAGTVDAFLALLLSRLPNLRKLWLEQNITKESRLTGMMLRSVLCQNNNHFPKYHDLRQVHWDACADYALKDRVINTADCLALFYLPGLESLRADIENPSSLEWPSVHPPTAANLTTLHLTRARQPLLGHILRATPRLKFLRWYWRYDRVPIGEDPCNRDPTMDLDELTNALLHVRCTLKHLLIDAGCDRPYPSDPELPDIYFRGSLRGLKQMETLERLEAPLPVLMGSFSTKTEQRLEEVLPGNLENLDISDDFDSLHWHYLNEWEGEFLPEVVGPWLENGRWQYTTRRLRCLSLVMKWMTESEIVAGESNGSWEAPVQSVVEEICRTAGVEFRIIRRLGN